MFSTLALFQALACPDQGHCARPHCLFSHRPDSLEPPALAIPLNDPAIPRSHRLPSPPLVPSKRPVRPSPASSPQPSCSSEPPRKLQKVGHPKHTTALPSQSYSATGAPILRLNAALSLIALPVRQTMLKTLYDQFLPLYSTILPDDPTIAAEHALKQEIEIYQKSSKHTYRNAVIQCAASIKRRARPTSLSHPSVGTEAQLAARAEQQKTLQALRVTRARLEPLVMSMQDMEKWGYFVNVPDTPGGDQPSMEGKTAKCERCSEPFLVKRMEDAEECIHHWGKLYTTIINGSKSRVYSCCSKSVSGSEGCTQGPHVFYESKAEQLHSRHPFSLLKPPDPTSLAALEIAALDCEMVYTTGGMRVARVSVVDATGREVFDEIVRMDEGVHVIDYITRFSGITPEIHANAVLPLDSIRKSLDALINTDTILIGHALDNDLKTLRIIHHKCVDTAVLFPHRAGAPYRRSLRDLAREKLDKVIQIGDGSVGHSSVEDAIATLDLVRWYLANNPGPSLRS